MSKAAEEKAAAEKAAAEKAAAEAAAAEQAAAAAAAVPEQPKTIKVGDKLNLTAAFGQIINPFTGDDFDHGKINQVTVDRWTKVQFDAGKLKLV